MKFEMLLARKYIFSQKRHTLLTICSIVIAVTLMALLFTGYSTLQSCMREAAYAQAPYHMRFTDITAEQALKLSRLPEVESYKKASMPDKTIRLDIMLKPKSIGDIHTYVEDVANRELGMDYSKLEKWREGHLDVNYDLVERDLIDDNGRKDRVQLYCIFFVFVIMIALTLRLIIDTAFEISSKEREQQFGVLQSVGATPKQIVGIMTMEGIMLSVVGIPIGLAVGTAVAYIAFRKIAASGIADVFYFGDKADEVLKFNANPIMLAMAAVVSIAWVLFSAYGTGMRVIKKSPVEAISARDNNVKKVRRHTLMGMIFGWTGKLTSRNARRQPKRYIITILSLTLSLSLFAGVGSTIEAVTNFEEAIFAADADSDMYISTEYSIFDKTGYRPIVEKLEKSKYFSHIYIDHGINAFTKNKARMAITYVNEDSYNRAFFGKPPISYDELKNSGGYILVTDDEVYSGLDSIELTFNSLNMAEKYIEEYNQKVKEDPESYLFDKGSLYMDFIHKASEDGTLKRDASNVFKIVKTCPVPVNENSYMYSDQDQNDYYAGNLIATIDQYEETENTMFGNFDYGISIECDLAHPRYHMPAIEFINANKDMQLSFDFFYEVHNIRTITSAFSIASNFITVLIALVAIVNMINIISTGIINRQSELASMECVGMTKWQLYKMAVIEGLQYTIFGAAGAIVLCILMIFATEQFLIAVQIMTPEGVGSLIKISTPTIRILGATGFTLLVSIAAAIVPLKRMQKTSLIDRIRSVE